MTSIALMPAEDSFCAIRPQGHFPTVGTAVSCIGESLSNSTVIQSAVQTLANAGLLLFNARTAIGHLRRDVDHLKNKDLPFYSAGRGIATLANLKGAMLCAKATVNPSDEKAVRKCEGYSSLGVWVGACAAMAYTGDHFPVLSQVADNDSFGEHMSALSRRIKVLTHTFPLAVARATAMLAQFSTQSFIQENFFSIGSKLWQVELMKKASLVTAPVESAKDGFLGIVQSFADDFVVATGLAATKCALEGTPGCRRGLAVLAMGTGFYTLVAKAHRLFSHFFDERDWKRTAETTLAVAVGAYFEIADSRGVYPGAGPRAGAQPPPFGAAPDPGLWAAQEGLGDEPRPEEPPRPFPRHVPFFGGGEPEPDPCLGGGVGEERAAAAPLPEEEPQAAADLDRNEQIFLERLRGLARQVVANHPQVEGENDQDYFQRGGLAFYEELRNGEEDFERYQNQPDLLGQLCRLTFQEVYQEERPAQQAAVDSERVWRQPYQQAHFDRGVALAREFMADHPRDDGESAQNYIRRVRSGVLNALDRDRGLREYRNSLRRNNPALLALFSEQILIGANQ